MAYPNLTLKIIDSNKVPGVGFFTITPAVAAAILDKRNPTNRHISPTKAAQAAHDVAHGEFVLNGESLIFDNEGNLLDGQHRLDAVVKGNKAISSVVTMGMPPAVRDTVDQGKARSARDVMTLNGYANANELASVGRHLRGYYEGDGSNFGRIGEYSTTEVIDWIDANPRVHDIAAWAVSMKKPLLGLLACTQIAVARAILEPKYGEAPVTDFLERVAYGDNIGKTHPAYAVRRKLQSERTLLAKEGKRISNPVAVEILMRGYLSHHHGRSLSVMKLMNELPSINKTARAATAASKTLPAHIASLMASASTDAEALSIL